MSSSVPLERVFLSCASSEFAAERRRLANHLRALVSRRFDVVVQEDLRQGGFTLLERLADCIRDCDLVIHIAGIQCGARPSPTHVAALYQRLVMPLPQPAPDRSYTQWEYRLARQFDKPTLVYLASAEAPRRDPDGTLPPPQRDDEIQCQQDHLQTLRSSGEHRSWFDGPADLVRRVLHDLGRDGTPLRKPFNIDLKPLGSLFKGRDEFLLQIRQALGEAQNRGATRAAAITANATAATVHGLGGIGKTRAAVEFAQRHADDYTALLMVRADSPEKLDDQLAQLCGPMVLDLPEQHEPNAEARVAAAVRWLRAHPGWFLIVDNVDTEPAAIAVERLLAQLDDAGQVLITSRIRNWSAGVSSLELDVLGLEDSVAFLLERTEPGRVRHVDDADQARVLAAALGHLALALEQAGAHVVREHLSFDDYLVRWMSKRDKVLAWFDARVMQYPASVAVTWLTTFEQLGEPACALMRTLACLAPDPIPRSIFADQPEALAELAGYSLLKWHDEHVAFSVHRLVQEVTRSRMEGSARTDALAAVTSRLAAGFSGDTGSPSSWPLMNLLAPHGAVVADAMSEVLSSIGSDVSTVAILTQGEDHIALASRMGAFCLRAGRYAAGEVALGLALRWRRALSGDEHPGTLTTMHNLASARMDQGDLSGARDLQQRAVEARRRLYGEEDPDTLSGMVLLASILRAQGDLPLARDLAQRVVQVRQQLFGEDHADTLRAMHNLAGTLKEQGELRAARILQDRIADAAARVFGCDHLETLTAQGALASTVLAQGDFQRARQLQEHVLERLRRVLSDAHPQTLTAMGDLAVTLRSQGDLIGSRELCETVLGIRQKVWGDTHPHTLTAMSNFASALSEQGNSSAARDMEENVLAARRQTLGEQHPTTLVAMSHLASTLQALGDLTGAQALLESVLAGRRKLFGDDGLATLTAASDLALVKDAQGDAAGARLLLERVLTARRRLLGDEHPETLAAKSSLGMMLAADKEGSRGRQMLEEVLRIQQRMLGEEHPSTLNSLNNLACALNHPADRPVACALLERALSASRRVFGEEHPKTLTSMGNLAATWLAQGRLAEALKLQKQALDAYGKLLGDEHPSTMTAQSNLAAVYKAQGDLLSARALEERALGARRRLLGQDHPYTQGSLFALYEILLMLKDERAVEMVEGEMSRVLKRTQAAHSAARVYAYFNERRAAHGLSTD